MMFRVRASFEALRAATQLGEKATKTLNEFVVTTEAWQHQHGYENSWSWPGLDEVSAKAKLARGERSAGQPVQSIRAAQTQPK